MIEFYKEQFELMLGGGNWVYQLIIMVLVVTDISLVFFSNTFYLNFTIPIFKVPDRFKDVDVKNAYESILLSVVENETIYINIKKIGFYYWAPTFLLKKGESRIKIGYTPLKLFGFILFFPFMYRVFNSPWGEPFKEHFSIYFLLSFFFVGIVFFLGFTAFICLTLLSGKNFRL